jgi:hypothetical protein
MDFEPITLSTKNTNVDNFLFFALKFWPNFTKHIKHLFIHTRVTVFNLCAKKTEDAICMHLHNLKLPFLSNTAVITQKLKTPEDTVVWNA